jgi:hypothetical protein
MMEGIVAKVYCKWCASTSSGQDEQTETNHWGSSALNFVRSGSALSILACRCGGSRNRMQDQPPDRAWRCHRRLNGYKVPYPPRFVSRPLPLLQPSLINGPLLTALLAPPVSGAPTRQLRCRLQTPSITFGLHLGLTHTHVPAV